MADRKTKAVPHEVYKGPCGVARESSWLTNEDLPHDRDTVVTIEEIRRRNNVEFTNETKKVAISAKFVGKERELLLNAGHRDILTKLSGSSSCGAWFGMTIALWVDPDAKLFGGKTGPAIRLRAKRITPTRTEAPKTDSASPTPDPIDADLEREENRSES